MIKKLKIDRALLALAFLICPFLINASPVSHLKIQHFDQKSGLEFVTVTSIKQDPFGFIWLASQDGLSRFDGNRFLTFHKKLNDPESLMDNFIWNIFADDDNSLWLATQNGFSQYQPLSENFNNHTLISGKEIIASSIISTATNQILVGTSGYGLFEYDKNAKKITPIIGPSLTHKDFINVLFKDNNGSGIWIGKGTNYISNQGRTGLSCYLPEKRLIKSFPVPFKTGIISITQADDDNLWIGTFGDGLWKFNLTRHTFSPGPKIPDGFIHALQNDNHRGLWVGTNTGLFFVKSGEIYPFMPRASKSDGPGNRLIKSLFMDRSENLWVGTWTDGLFKINLMENGFHLLDKGNDEQTLSDNLIPAATIYQNELWVAEWKNGIEKFSATGIKKHHYQHNPKKQHSLTKGYIRQLHVDKKNNLWIGSTLGLELYQPETDDFKHFRNNPENDQSLCGNMILELTSDSSGLWIGTRGGGSCFLAYGSSQFTSYRHNPANDNSMSNNNISVILPDPPYGIWFGTEGGGLNFLERNSASFTHFFSNNKVPFKLTHNNISALMLDTKNTLWVGTQGGGINRFYFKDHSRKIAQTDYISSSEGLSSDSIAAIVKGNDGKIWVGTSHGITSINTSGHMDYFETGDTYLIGSQFQNKNGDIYLGSVNGLRYFNPEKIKLNPYTIPVVLTRFLLNNKVVYPGEKSILKHSITLSKRIILPHDQTMFTIEFAGLDFQDPPSNQYRYQLRGFDTGWIKTNPHQHFATYTNIPSGEYQFKVIAANNASLWNSQGRSLEIKIEPSPWASGWAFILYSLLAFSVFSYLAWEYRQRELMGEQYNKKLKNKEQRLLLSLWGSGNELWDWNMITDEVVRSNELDLITLPKNLLNKSHQSLKKYIHEKDLHRINQAYLLHRTNRSPIFECSYRIQDHDGCWIWVLDKGKIVEWDALGNPVRMSGTLENINPIKSTEERLKIIAKSLEKTSDGVWITDENFQFVFVNESFLKLTGNSKEQIYQTKLYFKSSENQNQNFEKNVKQYLRTEGKWQGEVWDVTSFGQKYLQQLNIDSILDEDGNISHFIGVFSDITHRKKTDKQLRDLIKNDRLTGLLNYTWFLQITENIINQRNNSGQLKFAVIFVSIDKFKFINEHYGLDVGDALLVSFAKRLKSVSPSDDTLARLGGDDFVILKDTADDSEISNQLSQLRETLTKPYPLSKSEIIISISIGIAYYPQNGSQANELSANAHAALNQIKQNDGDGIQIFNEIIRSRTNISQQLDAELRYAIENNELELHFQPRVNLSNGYIETIETFLCWNSPRRGLILPKNFLPMAEKTGLIFAIGQWVVQHLFSTLREWESLLSQYDFGLHVSIEQLKQLDFADNLKQHLEQASIPGAKIELIIKDSKNWHKSIVSNTNIHRLRDMNCKFSLANFGSSDSNIIWLRENLLSSVKISRQLISDLEHNAANQEVIKGLIYTANNMKLNCLANGVETVQQANWLKQNGCYAATGYLFSPPLNASDFIRFMDNWQPQTIFS